LTNVKQNANKGVAPFVRGIEIASRFFWEVGLPVLEAEFPQYIDRLAAGLVAAGSECSDNDDGISRDCDWGPRFHIFLRQSDFNEIGSDVQAVLDRLPCEFHGAVYCSSNGRPACQVYSIDEFFAENVSLTRVPESPADWLKIPENSLFEVTRGQVFYDPLGEFSERRSEFANYYPEDVWKKRLATALYECSRQGQQLLVRSMARGDYYTAQIAWWSFVQSAMRVGFLLSRRYAPGQKWLYREFCKLPEPSMGVTNLLWEGQCDLAIRPALVERIAAIYDAKMCDLSLVHSSLDCLDESFIKRAEEVLASIADRSVAQFSLHTDEVLG
jgi:hypothetical protein